ncbi:MBL fold metallo-hydrolase [Agrobacterium tumefaciens]|uniref:MBL fold metallo-hydrolase n=1 Tax=Agrobacterium tumefaciens TaxID=358 RepID=UPI0022022CD4|nr:MBL fold metallo-hydrolase [Agrobacterium tumefaciens]
MSEANTDGLAPNRADDEFHVGFITVRMYRDILGDCFFLRFPDGERTVHMLIDFGILQGMPDAKKRARRIMADIASLTKTIDILVVTHEHVDHLSGFYHARDLFEPIEVRELWLAWTEDPRDEQANRLRQGRKAAIALLEKSYNAFVARGYAAATERPDDVAVPSKRSPLDGLRNVMSFAGVGPGSLGAGSDATTGNILKTLKAKAAVVRYLEPGENAFALAGLTYVQTYVMGPPRDDAMLRKSDPSKAKPEVYALSGQSEDGYLLAASITLDDGPDDLDADALRKLKMSLPFGFKNLIALDSKSETIGAQQDRDAQHAFLTRYKSASEDWRRIDVDWLWAAETIALKLDSDTNNTSVVLALAIGDGEDRRVLLFPGDAQVGNWLSWSDYVWPKGKRADDDATVTSETLLSKTVLYKVGHHASHNATLRERGLELMTHPDLTAMIPVHQEFANTVKHWNMPFPSLLKRLEEKTRGRVIRADRGKDAIKPATGQETGEGGAEWGAFLSNLREVDDAQGAIALEYRLRLPKGTNKQ